MNTMNNGTSWNDAVTINKQSGTKITLDTDGKFVAKDIELTINVQAGSAATPNTTITANPTLSVDSSTGVVTANVNATESISPTVTAGYISTGSAGTMTVNGSNTLSLTTQAAQTITPGTTNQTIAAGKYLTGVQTIQGDSNLTAGNIANGITIFGITGTNNGNITLSTDADNRVVLPTSMANTNVLTLQTKSATPGTTAQSITCDNGYDGLSAVNVAGDANLVAENIADGVSIFGVIGTHLGEKEFAFTGPFSTNSGLSDTYTNTWDINNISSFPTFFYGIQNDSFIIGIYNSTLNKYTIYGKSVTATTITFYDNNVPALITSIGSGYVLSLELYGITPTTGNQGRFFGGSIYAIF